MFGNRIAGWFSRTSQVPHPAPCGFMACPAVLMQGVGEEQLAQQQRLYQWAMEQAAAVVRPSIVERWSADLRN